MVKQSMYHARIVACFLLVCNGDAFLAVGRGLSGRTQLQNSRRSNEPDGRDASSMFVATCVPGLSQILAQELQDLGCTEVDSMGGAAVRFRADGPTALSTLLWARTPHKLMEFLVESPPTLQTRQDLHQFVYDEIPVQSLLGNGQGGLLNLAVSTILNAPRLIPADINHSHYTALTVKNALCDAVRDLRSDRPDVNLENPDVPLVAVIRGTESGAQLTLYRQLHSNSSLHKRGYRPSTIHKAALKESLAAGLLMQANWHQTCQDAREAGAKAPILIDPMAGSGTLVLEGLLMAADVAPHLMRIKTSIQAEEAAVHQIPPMLRWKDYSHLKEHVWPQLLRQATTRAKEGLQWLRSNNGGGKSRVQVNDMHTGALALFDESLALAGLDGLVDIHAGDCIDWQPVISDGNEEESWTVVCNPPWGVRLEENVDASWEALGKFLKQTCPGGRTKAFILSGNAGATKSLGLRRSQSMPIKVGTQDLRWLEYELRGPVSLLSTSEETTPPHVEKLSHDQWGDGDRHIEEGPSQRRRVPPRVSGRVPERARHDNNRKTNRAPDAPYQKRKQQTSHRAPAAQDNEWLID